MSQLTASRIASALAEAGLSKMEAARQLGVSRSSIQSWTSGRYEPSPHHLVRIAELTGKSADWLRGNTSGLVRPHHPRGVTALVNAILSAFEDHRLPDPDAVHDLGRLLSNEAVQRMAKRLADLPRGDVAQVATGLTLAMALEVGLNEDGSINAESPVDSAPLDD